MNRLCVPIAAPTLAQAESDFARAEPLADLLEWRLDFLHPEELALAVASLPKLLATLTRQLILTLRPASHLDLGARCTLWAQIFAILRPLAFQGFADLELELLEQPVGRQLVRQMPGQLELIASYHDFEPLTERGTVERVWRRLLDTSAAYLKLAVTLSEATQTRWLIDLAAEAHAEGREFIGVGMGAAGALTRILAEHVGSAWSYAALDTPIAPGQFAVQTLRQLYRVHQITTSTPLYGVVGYPVSHSLSPALHNAAFAQTRTDGVYLPLEVQDLTAFFRDFVHPVTRHPAFNFAGLSITAPHKISILKHLNWIDPVVRAVGAVNTVVIEGNELRGYNTDAPAALTPIIDFLLTTRRRVAVLGAGGAAKAVLWGLNQTLCQTTVYARDVVKTRSLATAFGVGLELLTPSTSFASYNVVINTTSLGTTGDLVTAPPATAAQLRGVEVCYDLTYNPSPTHFLREAAAADCTTYDGWPMFLGQAARQFELWTGLAAPTQLFTAERETYKP